MNIFAPQKVVGGWLFGDQVYVDTPDPVQAMQGALSLVEASITGFTISWLPALVENGVIDGYEISVNGGSYMRIGDVLGYTFTWMAHNTQHVVTVRSYIDPGLYSAPLTNTFTTGVYPPATRRTVLINKRLADPTAVTTVVVFPKVT